MEHRRPRVLNGWVVGFCWASCLALACASNEGTPPNSALPNATDPSNPQQGTGGASAPSEPNPTEQAASQSSAAGTAAAGTTAGLGGSPGQGMSSGSSGGSAGAGMSAPLEDPQPDSGGSSAAGGSSNPDPSPGTACGPALCAPPQECCNASCGICAPPGGGCIQLFCEPADVLGACTNAGDCRLFEDYCTGCDCRALALDQPDPPCPGPGVQCFAPACLNKVAVCDNGRCAVSDAP